MGQTQHCSGFNVFLLVACLSFGYAMCRHVLVAIQDPLIEHFEIDAVKYNLLQSLYSWPNSLTCAVSGIFIDKIGLNTMLFASFTSSWIGLIIMAISTISKQMGYTLLCISRTIVGPSNEALRIALRIFILKQFDVSKYGIVIAVFEGIIFIWSSLNNVVMFQLYLLFDSIPTALLIPSIIYPIVAVPLFSYLLHQINQGRYAKQSMCGMKLEKQTQKESESSQLISDNVNTSNQREFHLTDIKSFDLTYWFLILSGSACGTSLTCFLNIQISFFHRMYGYTYTLATILGVIGSITVIITTSIFGIITDKYGIKCKLIFVACCCASLAHYLYGWVHINLFVTIWSIIVFNTAIGIGAVVYWSSIPFVVNDNMVGTGYGIYTSLIFIFNGLGYIIVGLLTSEQGGVKEYENVQYFLIALPVVAALLILIVLQLDIRNGGKLENPKNK